MNDYSTLGLSPDATKEEVKVAFRKKAMAYHPDRHFQSSHTEKAAAAAKFKACTEAYQRLISDTPRVASSSSSASTSGFGNYSSYHPRRPAGYYSSQSNTGASNNGYGFSEQAYGQGYYGERMNTRTGYRVPDDWQYTNQWQRPRAGMNTDWEKQAYSRVGTSPLLSFFRFFRVSSLPRMALTGIVAVGAAALMFADIIYKTAAEMQRIKQMQRLNDDPRHHMDANRLAEELEEQRVRATLRHTMPRGHGIDREGRKDYIRRQVNGNPETPKILPADIPLKDLIAAENARDEAQKSKTLGRSRSPPSARPETDDSNKSGKDLVAAENAQDEAVQKSKTLGRSRSPPSARPETDDSNKSGKQ